jgi:hypothetical protein
VGVNFEGNRKGSSKSDIFLIKYFWLILRPKNSSI